MKYILMFLSLFITVGCMNKVYPMDDSIVEHTALTTTYTKDNFEIEIMWEDANDPGKSTVPDTLLFATELMQKETNDTELFQVTMFVPATMQTWEAILQNDVLFDATRGIYTDVTELDDFLVALQPLAEAEDIDTIVNVYLHELTHWVETQQTGDSPDTHANPAYWGKNGLWKRVYASYLNAKKTGTN